LSLKDADGGIGGSVRSVKVSWRGHLGVSGGAWLRPLGHGGERRLCARWGGRDSDDSD
jgi:hypothetical protein